MAEKANRWWEQMRARGRKNKHVLVFRCLIGDKGADGLDTMY